jgi:hypothetical protein
MRLGNPAYEIAKTILDLYRQINEALDVDKSFLIANPEDQLIKRE